MFQKVDGIMATYIDAAEEFGKSARSFLQQADLLSQAWKAYQGAVTASAELRKALDANDEALRILVTQLEHAVSGPFGNPALGEKRPEAVKAEVMKASAASAGAGSVGVVKTLP
jgi:hypothetical protein